MKQTRRFLALLLALCLSWSQVSPALAVALDGEQTEPVVVVEETVAPEVVETEVAVAETEAPAAPETEAPAEEHEVVVTEAAVAETEAPELMETGAAEEEPAGSSAENPIMIDAWQWNDEHTAATYTVTVPVGTTWYSSYGIGGMELTINDGEPTTLTGNPRMPAVFSVTNDGEAEAEFVLKVGYAVGSQMNPEVLSDLTAIEVSVPENSQGYYYSYTVAQTGTYAFSISSITEGVEGDIVITNMNSYAQLSLSYDAVDGVVNVEAAAGDELQIIVGVLPDASWNYPAADITWGATFTPPAPGSSAENPISLDTWTWNENHTAATATVTVPVGTTWYTSYGIGGMELTINDGEPTLLSGGNPRMPVTFSVTNNGEAEAEFTLKVAYPAGSQANPVALTELTGGTVSLPANSQGYYYTYTAAETGTYTFYISSITEGVEGDIIVTNMNTYQQKVLSYDGVDNYGLEMTMDVTAGDELQIIVAVLPDASWNYPAADITWTANFAYPAGSELNPIMPEFAWNETYTEATATVTVPAQTTYHFAAYASGMLLSINGAEPFQLVAQGMGRVPATFTITNDAEEAAEYTLLLTYPAGTMENPEVLYGRGESTASIESNDYDGYFYTYTADATGTLEFSILEITEGVEADIAVMKGYASMSLMYDGVDGVLSVPVTAGDELTIQVVVLPDANWQYPAADITWNFNFPVGSENNPVWPEFTWNEEYTEADATVTVPAGATYVFAVYAAGMELTINGGNAQILTAQGMGRVPATFTITNDGTEAAEYALHLAYPAGHMQNPEVLSVLGTNFTAVEAGDMDGYYYTYTAEADGILTFTLDGATEGVEADIAVMKGYASLSLMYDGVDGVLSVPVTAGDELNIQIVVLPDMNWQYPAADLQWTMNYAAGHELNPIFPEFAWNEAYTEAEAVVTVPAGMTYHYGIYGANGMMLSINGAEPFKLVAQGMGRVPVYFSVANDTEADAEYVLKLTYPVGSRMNPAELQLADEYNPDVLNIATVEEGNWDGYIFSWVAPEQGQLTITMKSGKAGWNYSIQNMTTYASTDIHASADAPAVPSETISVNAGDEIWIMVNTCGEDIYDVTPAGSVYFTAEYTMAVGIESNPIQPEWNWNENQTEATATFTAPVGTTYYAITMSGMMMTVNGGEAFAINGSRWMAEIHTFENTGAEPVEVTLHIFFPEGTMSNPADITEGTTTAELAEATEGMYYEFIAPDRGEVTITINSETGWQYQVNNLTSYIYGDYHWFDDQPAATTETVSVNKGDQVVIFVNTYDPANPWSAPAGTVSFDVAFTAGEGTETNPIMIYNAAEGYYGEIPVDATYHFNAYGIGGMYMTLYGDPGLTLELAGETITMNENGYIYTLVPSSPMGGRMPVSFSISNNGENGYSTAVYGVYFEYPYGSMSNPALLTIGKNTAAVEENSQTYFSMIAEKSGYLTVTMTSKAWAYTLNNLSTGIYGDNLSSDDETVVKSQTIKVNAGDEVQLVVSMPFSYETYTSPAGTVKFTASFATTQYNLLSGKSVTLKFIDPATGKTVSASKAAWEITSGAEFATLKGAKLTANSDVAAASEVVVTATYGEVVNTFLVTITPAATSITIYNEQDYVPEASGPVTEEVTGQTLNVYTNGGTAWPKLVAVVNPEGALNEVTWKSSNTKIGGLDSDGNLYLMWNDKTDSLATGTVTFTATAADGSGKKANVKLVISTLVEWMDITDSKGNYVYEVGSGKSLQLKANVNADATNKKVTWEIVEGGEYAKITASGKLTANKGLTSAQTVVVKATAQDAGACAAYLYVTITPVANKVVITGAPEGGKFDMNSYWPAFYLGAEVYAAGDAEGIPTASQGVTWKSSNPKIATIDEYGEVYCNKPGTVTFTATANDGSNKKATVKVIIVKSVSYIEMQSEAIIAGGKSLTLKPAVYEADATNKKLTWTLTDLEGNAVAKTLATLKNGKLTTKKVTEPTTVIATCTTTDGSEISASCYVTIFPATTKVTIMQYGQAVKGTQNMTAGQEKVFYAECLPENAAGQYTWKSSNEKIAKVEVNADGSVTVIAVGEKTGTVKITATAADGSGKKATLTIKVSPAPVVE